MENLINNPLITNLENGKLPTVNVEITMSKHALFEITIALCFVVVFACVTVKLFNRK